VLSTPNRDNLLTSLEQREFSLYASNEKSRFLWTAEQANKVQHNALE
jgi:hypothetical protein